MRPTGYKELVEPDNKHILGTLTHETWMGLAVEEAASKWYSLDPNLAKLVMEKKVDPVQEVIDIARLSSGSIGGEHRKDLTQGIAGAPGSSSALSVNVGTPETKPAPQEAPKNGFRKG